jgi:4-aminobutyrate aminotransferase-like enzyme
MIDMIVEERLPERAARVGSTVMARLDAFAKESELVGDVRGSGLMIGVELVRNRATKEPASAEAAAVKRHCRERGVLIGVGGSLGNVVRIQPPLVIGEEDLDRAIGVIEEAVSSLSAQPVG